MISPSAIAPGLPLLRRAGFASGDVVQVSQCAWQAHVQRPLADAGKACPPACAAKSAGVLLSPACVGLSSWLAHGHFPFDAITSAHAFVAGRVETMT